MSDIELVFKEALILNDDNKSIDYIFDQLECNYNDEEIIKMWTDYLYNNSDKLCNNRVKKMQVGGGISSTLGWAKNKGYTVVVENPYE